jgi:triacylglycerol lipase
VLAVVTGVQLLRGRAIPRDVAGPVLLVAGYGGSTAVLAPAAATAARLRTTGRAVRVVPPPGDNTGDLLAR